MIDAFPPFVLAAAASAGTVVTGCTVEPIRSGAQNKGLVDRLVFQAGSQAFTVIRKTFRPGADDPGHWSYWQRELLAYRSGVLPGGPGLAAPRLLGMDDTAVFLEPADGPAERPELAAERLAVWQAETDVPQVPWLADHPLAQRVAATELDWTAVAGDPALAGIWGRRDDLLDALGAVPSVFSHGDFHPGNLVADGPGTTIVLGWGSCGVAPVGADLAHLALGTLRDQLPFYLKGSGGRFAIGDVILGYRVTLALTGVSRIHEMSANGIPVPADLVRFVKVQAAAIPW